MLRVRSAGLSFAAFGCAGLVLASSAAAQTGAPAPAPASAPAPAGAASAADVPYAAVPASPGSSVGAPPAAASAEPPTYGAGPYSAGPVYTPSPSYYPAPPPRAPRELVGSIRFNPLDLIFGKANLELEYAFAGPFSLVVAPQYIFADSRQDSDYGVSAKGWGFFAQVGYWIDGRPLRGYFIKAHLEHDEVTFKSDLAELKVPQTLVGAMFGSQSIHAGWFTLSGGLGVAVDLASEKRQMFAKRKQDGATTLFELAETGPLENGVDFLGQLAIGGSF